MRSLVGKRAGWHTGSVTTFESRSHRPRGLALRGCVHPHACHGM